MKNLLLLALLCAAAWYLLFDKPVAPPPAPVVQAPPPRADYSGVRTFYSPLNDPPVSANGGNGAYSSAVVLGAGQQVGNSYRAAPTSTGTTTSSNQATSSIGLGGAGNR